MEGKAIGKKMNRTAIFFQPSQGSFAKFAKETLREETVGKILTKLAQISQIYIYIYYRKKKDRGRK